MKRYPLIVFLLYPFFCISQNTEATVKTFPSIFTSRDSIKIIIDVSEVTELADDDSLYLWAWKDKPGGSFQNGSWENSNEKHRLIREDKGIFSFRLVPYQFYGEHPDSLQKIQFLVKAKNGSGNRQTDDIILYVKGKHPGPKVEDANANFSRTTKTIGNVKKNPFLSKQAIHLSPFRVLVNNLFLTIDQRSELLYTLAFLMGSANSTPANDLYYVFEIKKYFSKYRNHKAVSHLERLWNKGIGVDGPINIFLNLDPNFELLPTTPAYLSEKAGGLDSLYRFVADVKDFYADARFDKFFLSHHPFYKRVLQLASHNFRDFNIVRLLEKYYGHAQHEYNVVLNLLNYGDNFSVISGRGSQKSLYAVISSASMTLTGDLPILKPSLLNVELIAHEFSHAFVNHLIDEHYQEVMSYSPLYKHIRRSMQSQGYQDWSITVKEHIVRAVTNRIAELYYGKDLADAQFYDQQIAQRFIYTEALTESLKKYEKQRDKYPLFSSYFPQLIQSFSNLDKEAISRLQNTVKRLREPAVEAIPLGGSFSNDTTTAIIISTHEPDSIGQKQVNDYAQKFMNLFPNKFLVLKDEEALKKDLSQKNIIAIGTPQGNSFIGRYIGKIPIKIQPDKVVTNKILPGNSYQLVLCWVNPFNPNKSMILHTAQQAKDIANYFWSSLKGNTHFWVAEKLATIDRGNFIKYMGHWLPQK